MNINPNRISYAWQKIKNPCDYFTFAISSLIYVVTLGNCDLLRAKNALPHVPFTPPKTLPDRKAFHNKPTQFVPVAPGIPIASPTPATVPAVQIAPNATDNLIRNVRLTIKSNLQLINKLKQCIDAINKNTDNAGSLVAQILPSLPDESISSIARTCKVALNHYQKFAEGETHQKLFDLFQALASKNIAAAEQKMQPVFDQFPRDVRTKIKNTIESHCNYLESETISLVSKSLVSEYSKPLLKALECIFAINKNADNAGALVAQILPDLSDESIRSIASTCKTCLNHYGIFDADPENHQKLFDLVQAFLRKDIKAAAQNMQPVFDKFPSVRTARTEIKKAIESYCSNFEITQAMIKVLP